MTKLEVVVRGGDVGLVTNMLTAAGVTGYTSLSGASGFGHHGYHEGWLLFNDTDTLALIITVMPDDRADAVLAGLRELFEDHAGVVFVSEIFVSRPAYFSHTTST